MISSQLAEALKEAGHQPASLLQVQPNIERMRHPASAQFGKSGQRSAAIGADKDGVNPMHLSPSDALVLRQVGGTRGSGMQLDQHLLGRVVGTNTDLESLDDRSATRA